MKEIGKSGEGGVFFSLINTENRKFNKKFQFTLCIQCKQNGKLFFKKMKQNIFIIQFHLYDFQRHIKLIWRKNIYCDI